MSNKEFFFSDIDDLDVLSDDDVIKFDDRSRKFDTKRNCFVSPHDEGYDDLPELEY